MIEDWIEVSKTEYPELVKNLDKNTEDGKDSFWNPEIGRYHASYPGQCLRKIFLMFKLGTRIDEESKKNFKKGNEIEEKVLAALREKYGWRSVKNSYPVEINMHNYEIVGETDPVLLDSEGCVDRLFEVKSISSLYYVWSEPKPSHIMQVHFYMESLDLDECTFIYISKRDFSEIWHTVSFSKEVFEFGLNRVENLHGCLVDDVWPEPDPFLGNFECEEACMFSEECGD